MTRRVRYVGKNAENGGSLVVVSTSRSLWNPFVWIGALPYRHTKAYFEDNGVFMDFDRTPAPMEVSIAIREELHRIRV